MSYTTGRKIYIALSAIFLAAVTVIIFYLSAQTATESTETSDSVIIWIELIFGKNYNEDLVRTLAHFCEFAGLGFLTCNLAFAIKDSPKPLLSILLAFGYAITDEIHQIFIPGRAFQLTDLAVDLAGITLGVAVLSVLALLIKKYKNKKSH